MRKFFSYMFAGVLVSSLGVIACSDDATGDDDTTSSSSSSGGSSGASSSSGGKSSSSSGGSTSSSGGSSSGGTESDVEITSFTLTPTTATVDEVTTLTFELKYTGTAPTTAQGQVQLTLAYGGPEGAEEPVLGTLTGDPSSTAGDIKGSIPFTAKAAGAYQFALGFDLDGDQTTTDDQILPTPVIVTAE